MNSSSNEMKKFDISNPSTFEVFDKEMISLIGLHCDGVMISAVRDERLDYSLSTCVFEPEYTIVGRGRQYKGVVMPEGLNYDAFRVKFPLEKLNNKEVADNKKKADLFLASVAKAIVLIEEKMTRNTLTHFENDAIYLKARDSQDIIALIREIRKVGPVGTVSSGAALVNWQAYVSKPEKTRYDLVHGCNCDLNEFSTRWRSLYTTIHSFDQAQTLKEVDFVRGLMRSLPEDDSLLSPVKANNLARPSFSTLNEALVYLHDTITQANRDVGSCCKPDSDASRKRKSDEIEGLEENRPGEKAESKSDETSIEILKILKIMSQKPKKQECRRYVRIGNCTWEKENGSPCKFDHPGKHVKKDGAITRVEKENKKGKSE